MIFGLQICLRKGWQHSECCIHCCLLPNPTAKSVIWLLWFKSVLQLLHSSFLRIIYVISSSGYDFLVKTWEGNYSYMLFLLCHVLWVFTHLLVYLILFLFTGTHPWQSSVLRSWRAQPQNSTLPWHPWPMRVLVVSLRLHTPCRPPMVETSPPPPTLLTPPGPRWFRRQRATAAPPYFRPNLSPSSLRSSVTTATRTCSCSCASTAASSPPLPIFTASGTPWRTGSSLWWRSRTTPRSTSMVCVGWLTEWGYFFVIYMSIY